MNIDHLQTSLLPIAAEYFIARRRYGAAVRRGDLKTAQAWLDLAEREMALIERYQRAEIKQDRQQAWQAEQPYRMKALQARLAYPR